MTDPLIHYDRLLRYAMSLCRNIDQAKDLVQTAYEQYYHNEYEGLTVLYRTIRHRYYNEKQYWYNNAERLDAILSPVTHDIDLYDAEYHQKRINSLGLFRSSVQLFLDGYSYKEIADKENITIGTVKSRIHSPRKKLGV